MSSEANSNNQDVKYNNYQSSFNDARDISSRALANLVIEEQGLDRNLVSSLPLAVVKATLLSNNLAVSNYSSGHKYYGFIIAYRGLQFICKACFIPEPKHVGKEVFVNIRVHRFPNSISHYAEISSPVEP